MIAHSGIGTQIQNVLALLTATPEVRLHLLGAEREIRRFLPDFAGPITEFNSPIYSMREQVHFPGPDIDEILHVPHYNAPIRYLGKTLVMLHDLIHLQSREFAKPQYRIYASSLLAMIARRAAHIATVSDTTRMEFLKRYPRAAPKTTVLYNGINHGLFRPTGGDVQRKFRRKYDLPAEYLLAVGIGKMHKNIDFVIRSLAPLWRSGTLKEKLVLAGTAGKLPEYVSAALERERAQDHLVLLPRVPEAELPAMYGAARLFIFPSLLEGFGFPLIESMACGTPAVSSSASCLPEIGADAALYFDPRDPESLRRAVRRVLEDRKLSQKMRTGGLRRSADFQWQKHVHGLIELYRTISPRIND